MSTPTTHGFCGPLPDVINMTISSKIVNGKSEYFVSHQSKLWPNGSTITYSFLDGTDAQKLAVLNAIPQFTNYANLHFSQVGPKSPASIRIAFDGTSAWSAVGTDALRLENQPTINLGIVDKNEPTDEQLAITLHEIGHSLGLDHEWDGKSNAIVDKLSPKDQGIATHAKTFANKTVSNYGDVDTKSIMTYFVPSHLSKDGNGIPPNLTLSDSDKAWLSLNYPGKNAESNGQKLTLLRSLSVLNVPAGVASQMLSANNVTDMRDNYSNFVSGQTGQQIGVQSATQEAILTEIAGHFANMGTPNVTLAAGIPSNSAAPASPTASASAVSQAPTPTPSDGVDQSLYDIFGSMVLNPQFQQVVNNIALNDLPNHGVKLSDYPVQNSVANGLAASGITLNDAQLQQGIFGALLPVITSVVGGLFSVQAGLQNGVQNGLQNGISTSNALPDNVQQGIFDAISKFVQNPVFTGIVKNIVTTVVNQPSS